MKRSLFHMLRAPEPGVATPGGGNGALSSAEPMTRDRLAQMVALREAPADSADPEVSRASSADDDPDNSNSAAGSDDAGQNDLSPGEGTEQPGDANGEPGGDEGNNLSDGASDGADDGSGASAELNEALRGLNADARKHLVEMAQAVAKGDVNLGDLKRGHKLAQQYTQEITALREEIAELKAGSNGAADGPAVPMGNLPPTVAKLKNLQEVKQREFTAKQSVRELTRFLRANPDGGQIGEKQYSADQIQGLIDGWQDELDVLPERAEQIKGQQATETRQREVRLALEEKLPQFYTQDNPVGKRAQELAKADPYLAGMPNRDFVSLALAIGEQELMKLLTPAAARPGVKPAVGKPNGAPANGKPVGKVPLGKPHGAPGGAPARAEGGVPVKTALEQVQKDGSRKSLATLLTATGR